MNNAIDPKNLTVSNYYTALDVLQMHNLAIDIMTITGFFNWEQKVQHYIYYFNKVKA